MDNTIGGGVEDWAFEDSAFELLASWSTASVSSAALLLPCADGEAGNSPAQVDWHLQQTTGISGFTCSMLTSSDGQSPSDLAYLCSGSGAVRVNVRALCPVACGCDAGPSGVTGAFGSVSYGCPQQCHDIYALRDQLSSATAAAPTAAPTAASSPAPTAAPTAAS